MNGNQQHQTQRIFLNASQLSVGSVTVEEEAGKYLALKRTSPYQILIVSDDPDNCMALTIILEREGWDTICTSSVSGCRESLKYHLPLVVTSRQADWDQYLEALRHGAFELIASPCRGSDVLWALAQADRRQ